MDGSGIDWTPATITIYSHIVSIYYFSYYVCAINMWCWTMFVYVWFYSASVFEKSKNHDGTEQKNELRLTFETKWEKNIKNREKWIKT